MKQTHSFGGQRPPSPERSLSRRISSRTLHAFSALFINKSTSTQQDEDAMPTALAVHAEIEEDEGFGLLETSAVTSKDRDSTNTDWALPVAEFIDEPVRPAAVQASQTVRFVAEAVEEPTKRREAGGGGLIAIASRSELLVHTGSGIFNVSTRQGSKASLHRKPRGPSVDDKALFEHYDQKQLVDSGLSSDGGVALPFQFEFVKQRAQSDPFPIYGSDNYFEDLFATGSIITSAAPTPAPPSLRKFASPPDSTGGGIEVPSTVMEDQEEHDDDVFVRERALLLLNMPSAMHNASSTRRESKYRASATMEHRKESIAVAAASRPSFAVLPILLSVSSNGDLQTFHQTDDAPQQDVSTLSTTTSNRLVEELVSSPHFMNPVHISDFLLTYNMFMDSISLVHALAFRFDQATRAKDEDMRERTLYVMQRWIEEHWYDFESNTILLEAAVQFAERRLFNESETNTCFNMLNKITTVREYARIKAALTLRNESASSQMTRQAEDDDDDDGIILLASRTLQKQASRKFFKNLKPPPPELAPNFSLQWEANIAANKPWHLVMASTLFTKVEFARQLTLLESKLFRKILPTEFIQHSTKQLATPPANVTQMIKHFNTMSKFVSSSICLYTEIKSRTNMMRRWIKIAKELLKMNNFNAVFEIMAGLHSVAAYRLHKTREYLSVRARNVLDFLEEVTSRKNNFASYRALLSSASMPMQACVPFIGAALADLSFLDMGHDTVLTQSNGDTIINFNKQRRVAQILGGIKAFQDYRYTLEPVQELQNFLQDNISRCTSVTDKEIYQLSLECEAYLRTSPTDFLADELSTAANHRKQQSRGGIFLFSKG